MILKLFYWIARVSKTRFIDREDGGLYLLRVLLRGWMPGDPKSYSWSLYLHKFYSADADPAPHNHPWKWSVSIPIFGGYIEERLDKNGQIVTRRVRRFLPNFFGRNTFHRIAMLHDPEVWTIFLCGPKFQGWGFMDAVHGFIPWRQRIEERKIIIAGEKLGKKIRVVYESTFGISRTEYFDSNPEFKIPEFPKRYFVMGRIIRGDL